MSEKDPTRDSSWVNSQVFSALLAAAITSGYYKSAVWTVLFAWLAGPAELARKASTLSLPPRFEWLMYAGVIASTHLWFRPIARFLATDDGALRETAVARVRKAPVFIAALWLGLRAALTVYFCWAARAVEPALPAGELLRDFVIPDLVAGAYGAYLTLLYLEPLFFTRIAHRFFAGDELYRRKSGLTFGLRARLLLFVVGLVAVPMLLIALMTAKPYPGEDLSDLILKLTIATLVYAVGYGEMLYRGIAEPIAELVRKMERLARGDFDVKTRVYTGDEIGVMKAHFNDMVDGLAERERLKDTFGRYVSVEVAKQLMKAGKIRLGGESIEATILFSDIRDFTPMSERMSPQELVAFLNDYFAHVTEPVSAHNGVVSKFIGDAVMAIFAPQFGSADHAGDAVRAALSMKTKLAEFNAKRAGAEPVRFGVGLHSGVLVAGNIGTEKRLEYTVIGDVVNVASRIESENKAQDSSVLVSEETYRRLEASLRDGLKAEKREDIRVKGKAAPLTLYKLA